MVTNKTNKCLLTSCYQTLHVDGIYIERLVEALKGLDLVVGLEVLDAEVDVLVCPLAVLGLANIGRVVLGGVVS